MSQLQTEQRNLNVLVVEDEALVALNLEDMLAELGYSVIGPAMRLSRALEMLDGSPRPDLAILDINIAGEPVFDLAERLSRHRIPIVFATGYGRSGLPQPWHDRPILQKPYTIDQVARGIQAALHVASEERRPADG